MKDGRESSGIASAFSPQSPCRVGRTVQVGCRPSMDLGIRGKNALVTGASMGIGRGIAAALSREGVRLAVVARRRNLLEELEKELRQKLVIIEQDFLQPGAPETIATAALDGLGSVDILINNAGGSRRFTLEASEAQWEEALDAQLHAPAPAHPPPAAADDGAQVGPHRQHHRQVRARRAERRLRCQGGDAFLGEGPVARGRKARHHGELRAAGPDHQRADPAQLPARVPQEARARRTSRWANTASRRTSRTWCASSPRRSRATSPAPSFPWTVDCGATSSEDS